MGILKRIIRRTSHRVMSALGAQSGSHQLVLNVPIQHGHRSSSNLRSLGRAKLSKRTKVNSKNAAIPEALLLAAKNYLPPVQFHHVHGPNAQLNKNKFVARRTQSFCQALVFSNRIILPNERVYIKVLEIAKGWSGTIRFGFTSVDPATLRYKMPKHACPDMTNAGHTWARALADEVVRRNSVIHFSYNANGFIHYGINNQDCGIFYANVNTSQHLWFIVDIYGLTAAVELIDPRIHNTSSEIDFTQLDEELRLANVSACERSLTMFKSTSGLNDEPASGATAVVGRRSKKKRAAARQAALIYGDQWTPEAVLMAQPMGFDPSGPQNLLPNLSSIVVPASQQNIYSPMPGSVGELQAVRQQQARVLRNINETHDYYQIMTNRTNEPHQAVAQNSRANLSHSLNSPTPTMGTPSFDRSRVDDDQETIRQQLDSFQMSDTNNKQSSAAATTTTTTTTTTATATKNAFKSSKSTASNSVASPNCPATTRRRGTSQQASGDSSMQTTTSTSSKKRLETSPKDQSKIAKSQLSSVSPIKAKAAQVSANQAVGGLKSRNRHSGKSRVSPATLRDNSNSPPAKDCPICFERPINCVLYQCGHMCTCYECGVKQWRTQSRTCPICRTVIKDVIKTYMS